MKTAQVVVFTEWHNSWLIYSVGFGKTTHNNTPQSRRGVQCGIYANLLPAIPEIKYFWSKNHICENVIMQTLRNLNHLTTISAGDAIEWILYFAYLPLQCIYIPPRSCFQNSLLLLRCCRNKGFVVPVISYCRDSVVKPKRSRFACFNCFPLAIMIHTSFLLQN